MNFMSGPFAYVIALIVLLCFLAAAIVAIIIREGNVSAAAPLISTILGLFGPTVGVLVLIIRQQHNITQVEQATKLINGHLDATVQQAVTDATSTASPTQ